MSKRDLFVVVADLDAENAIKTLLRDRQKALEIRVTFDPAPPPQGDLLRYVGHDSGCYRNAADLLRAPQRTHRNALLCFDRHGCGADESGREQIEAQIEQRLHASGWAPGSAAVVVLEPELEAWVWADSPHVAAVLGWQDERNELRPYIEAKGVWDKAATKPRDPKEALRRALRKKRQAGGAPLFARLASKVSVERCQDPAFRKFRSVLKQWFSR